MLRATLHSKIVSSNIFFDWAPSWPHVKVEGRALSYGFSWMSSIFSIASPFIGNYQSLATEAASSEGETVDQLLHQIIIGIKNDPDSKNEICTACIHKLCRAKKLSTAVRLMQSLHSQHLFLTLQAYNVLLDSACEENNVELVVHIFKDVLLNSQSVNSATYTNLAKGLSKSTDSTMLLKLVSEVLELTSSGSVTVMNRIIYALMDIGRTDKALLIYDNLKDLKVKPDLFTYNTVLLIWGRLARIDEMINLFALMKEVDVVPDMVSYNTLFNGLCRVGRLDLCLVFLKEMEERGVFPDLRTYTVLIESFGRLGNVEESLRLLDEMKRRKIRPSIYVYRSIISNLKRMGKLELAADFSEEMNAALENLVGPKEFKPKNR